LFWVIAVILCVFASFAVFYITNNKTALTAHQSKISKDSKHVVENDKSVKQNLETAKDLYKSEKYEESAVLLQKEIDKNNDAVANYYMGEVYRAQGYLKIAIDYYKIADERKSNFFEAKKRLAMTYLDKHDIDSALDYGEKAYSINKKDKELLATLIHLYKIEEDDDRLLTLYQDLIKIDAKNYDANDYLAAYYFKRDNYKEAAKYIETLLSIKYNTDVAYILAVCYAKVEYYSQAIRVLNLIEKNDSSEYYNVQNYKENMQYLRDSYNYSHGRY
jgi:tetratricopeptide (TPR) repeat protein